MSENDSLKRTINRSAAYPGISLEEAIEATKRLRDNLGAGPYSRESAATALGYSGVSGASSTKVAACVHFGLLVREGNVYRQSGLAQRIFVYTDESEKDGALKEALKQPTLYGRLIDEFSGKALPKMLGNILVRNYAITERVSEEAASDFIKSAEFAGVLRNGVLEFSQATSEEKPQTKDTGVVESATESGGQADDASPNGAGMTQLAGYLPVAIPDSEIKVLFPASYAYELSIGTFRDAIQLLAKTAAQHQHEEVEDERSDTA